MTKKRKRLLFFAVMGWGIGAMIGGLLVLDEPARRTEGLALIAIGSAILAILLCIPTAKK